MTALLRIQQDLRLLLTSTTSDEVRLLGTAEENATWKRVLAAVVSDEPLSSSGGTRSGIGEEEEMGKEMRIAFKVWDGPECWANCTVAFAPPLAALGGKDEAEGKGQSRIWQMDISAPRVSRRQLEVLKLEALAHVHPRQDDEEEGEGIGMGMWETWVRVKQKAEEVFAIPQSEEEQERSKRKEDEEKERERRVNEGVEMKRSAFWSHHLVSPIKRRDIAAACAELQVWGMVKLGYPGYLIFEGPQQGVEEMERRIKAMQWHALTHRYAATYTFRPSDPSSSVRDMVQDAVRACSLAPPAMGGGSLRGEKARTACSEVNSLREVVERLTEAAWDKQLVVDCLGVRAGKKGLVV
ncbi:hypothetical protein ACQY0O_005426 [Thecaphora frezii]